MQCNAMITTVNQVSSAWFDNKLVLKSLHKTVMSLRWKSWNLLLQTNEHDNNQDKQEENDQQGNENIDNFKTCEEKK